MVECVDQSTNMADGDTPKSISFGAGPNDQVFVTAANQAGQPLIVQSTSNQSGQQLIVAAASSQQHAQTGGVIQSPRFVVPFNQKAFVFPPANASTSSGAQFVSAQQLVRLGQPLQLVRLSGGHDSAVGFVQLSTNSPLSSPTVKRAADSPSAASFPYVFALPAGSHLPPGTFWLNAAGGDLLQAVPSQQFIRAAFRRSAKRRRSK